MPYSSIFISESDIIKRLLLKVYKKKALTLNSLTHNWGQNLNTEVISRSDKWPVGIPIPAPMARTPPSAIIVSQKHVRFRFSGGESSFGTWRIRFGSSLSALVSTVVIISLWIETTSLAGIPSMSLAFRDDALETDPPVLIIIQ